jgi:hypothetical protein
VGVVTGRDAHREWFESIGELAHATGKRWRGLYHGIVDLMGSRFTRSVSGTPVKPLSSTWKYMMISSQALA